MVDEHTSVAERESAPPRAHPLVTVVLGLILMGTILIVATVAH
jgi:hypothetical protein